MKKTAIDRKDKEILSILKKDSRTPLRKIANQTGIKQSTIHQRIARLLRTGAIQKFTIKTGDEILGEGIIVFVQIANPVIDMQKLGKIKAVKEVHETAGEYNYLIKIKLSSLKEYTTVIGSIKKETQATKIISSISTSKLKEE